MNCASASEAKWSHSGTHYEAAFVKRFAKRILHGQAGA